MVKSQFYQYNLRTAQTRFRHCISHNVTFIDIINLALYGQYASFIRSFPLHDWLHYKIKFIALSYLHSIKYLTRDGSMKSLQTLDV